MVGKLMRFFLEHGEVEKCGARGCPRKLTVHIMNHAILRIRSNFGSSLLILGSHLITLKMAGDSESCSPSEAEDGADFVLDGEFDDEACMALESVHSKSESGVARKVQHQSWIDQR